MATEGPKFAATVAQRVNGSIPWAAPANVLTAGPSATASALSNGFVTDDLLVFQFGFTIPGGATIDGVQVDVRRQASNSSSVKYVTDALVQIVAGGTGSQTKADLVTKYSSVTVSTATYGGAADTWSIPAALTPASINDNNFGVFFGSTIFGDGISSVTASVDWIKVTVTYSTVAGGGSQSAAFLLGMIAPRKRFSFPHLWTPRPRPILQCCQHRRVAVPRPLVLNP